MSVGTNDGHSAEEPLEVSVTRQRLLETSLWNKGTAFSDVERRELGLLGLLPPHVESIDVQAARCYEAYLEQATDLGKHVYLRNLQDENETLFYRVILDHITEMMPIIYTPVVGEACQQFSHIYRRPRGLFISYPNRDRICEILRNCACEETEVIVVTDGERILGLGDQGAGGMGIPIGKLSLYTAIGGIDPGTTLPILLDAGTNNEERLNDPEYIGWRHERIRGEEYDAFVDQFVAAVKETFPNVLLQWEDFAGRDAGRLLERYRDDLCTFNDDIQGTAAVTTGALLSAVAVTGEPLTGQRVCVLGAGSAGCGVSEQLVRAMVEEGLGDEEARARIFLVDINGLMHDGLTDVLPFQRDLLQSRANLEGWKSSGGNGEFSFADVVANVKPTILIGLTGHADSFPEAIIREMAMHVERPIIFPLSNPTSRIEATPQQLLEWTGGNALIATGSPFEPIFFEGREIPIAQCNNSYIFPAMGLGILATGANRVTEEMFMAAACALRDASPALRDAGASLLPSLDDVRTVSRSIAIAVGEEAQKEGMAKGGDVAALVDEKTWEPSYRPYRLRE
ncbi:MAG: NAD-dependent malic enzyme [Verrucomicrobiota bacterium]